MAGWAASLQDRSTSEPHQGLPLGLRLVARKMLPQLCISHHSPAARLPSDSLESLYGDLSLSVFPLQAVGMPRTLAPS